MSATISSYAGLSMKFSTDTCTADADRSAARSARSWWLTTTSKSSVRLAIALLITVTSVKPAAWTFLRSTEAPIAEEPMPASQANTMLRIGSEAAVAAPTSAVDAIEDRPFIASMAWVALTSWSSASTVLSVLRSSAATIKVATIPPMIDSVTPTTVSRGVWA